MQFEGVTQKKLDFAAEMGAEKVLGMWWDTTKRLICFEGGLDAFL